MDKLSETGGDSRNFWEKIGIIFSVDLTESSDESEKIYKSFYVTDLGKCNCHGKHKIYRKCAEKYLIDEILLIRPKLIIAQGEDAKKEIIRLVKNDPNLDFSQKTFQLGFKPFISNQGKVFDRVYYKKPNNLGSIQYHGEFLSNFFSIPHTSFTAFQYRNTKEVWEKIGIKFQKLDFYHELI